MSLATFKKKAIISQHGTKISGKPPGGHWLPQGPFGKNTSINSLMLIDSKTHYGPSGFSLNGGHRNVGYVGQSMKMSKNGTSFNGIYPRGNGGTFGSYFQAEPVFNSAQVETLGTQYKYIKPTVLSNFGMLRKKYKWAFSGQYPNYWVQPNYGTSNLSDNTSQGVYIQNVSAASMCVLNVNDSEKFKDYIIEHGPYGCNVTNGGRYTFNNAASNAPYTKELHQPISSSQYTLYIQRKCVNPNKAQQPYPGPVNGNGCNLTDVNF